MIFSAIFGKYQCFSTIKLAGTIQAFENACTFIFKNSKINKFELKNDGVMESQIEYLLADKMKMEID